MLHKQEKLINADICWKKHKCALFFLMRAGYAKQNINLPWPNMTWKGDIDFWQPAEQPAVTIVGPTRTLKCKHVPYMKEG